MKKILVWIFVALLFGAPSLVSAQESPSIRIVKPGDRRNVELGEITVTVEITGVTLSEGYTWQMLIDAVPQGMVREGLTTNIVMGKPTGPHHLTAQLYDARGNVVSTHDILVIAAPVENREPIFNRAWFAPFMLGFTIVVFGIIALGLRLRPRPAV